MKSGIKYLIATCALVSLFFVFPVQEASPSDPIQSFVLLLLASTGILLSRIFILSSDYSDKIGIEPAVIVFLATWDNSLLIYPVTAVMAFSGSILNSIRMGKKIVSDVPEALFLGVSFAFLLRFSSFLFWSFQEFSIEQGAIQTYLAMIVAVINVIFLRCISVSYFSSSKCNLIEILKKTVLLNTFILLLAVPSTMVVLTQINTTTILVSCAFGLLSMLLVHGINLRHNRSAHEKTDELETVLRLKELSSKLFSAASEMDVLRALNKAVSEAWDCRSAVRWKCLTYFDGEKWDVTNSLKIQHDAGLTIWVDSFNSTIPVYMESFLNRAVPVLSGLEAEKKMKKTSWESIETMISFVERNTSDFAGFSRRVTTTAVALSKALERDMWFEDCIRLAGLLHMVSLPKASGQIIEGYPHALPAITLEALKGMKEHWCGTGATRKTGEEIPLPARILAVSIAWEKAMNSGTAMAVRDMNMRAGTIYDPRLAELVIQLNS